MEMEEVIGVFFLKHPGGWIACIARHELAVCLPARLSAFQSRLPMPIHYACPRDLNTCSAKPSCSLESVHMYASLAPLMAILSGETHDDDRELMGEWWKPTNADPSWAAYRVWAGWGLNWFVHKSSQRNRSKQTRTRPSIAREQRSQRREVINCVILFVSSFVHAFIPFRKANQQHLPIIN